MTSPQRRNERIDWLHPKDLPRTCHEECSLGLKSVKDALAQQGKGRSTVHHPFDELDFRHLTFV